MWNAAIWVHLKASNNKMAWIALFLFVIIFLGSGCCPVRNNPLWLDFDSLFYSTASIDGSKFRKLVHSTLLRFIPVFARSNHLSTWKTWAFKTYDYYPVRLLVKLEKGENVHILIAESCVIHSISFSLDDHILICFITLFRSFQNSQDFGWIIKLYINTIQCNCNIILSDLITNYHIDLTI